MDNSDIILQWLLAGLVGLLILFFVIKLAVAAGTKKLADHSRTTARLMIIKMLKEGYTREQIASAIHDSDTEFWNFINTGTPAEKESYLEEIKKAID